MLVEPLVAPAVPSQRLGQGIGPFAASVPPVVSLAQEFRLFPIITEIPDLKYYSCF